MSAFEFVGIAAGALLLNFQIGHCLVQSLTESHSKSSTSIVSTATRSLAHDGQSILPMASRSTTEKSESADSKLLNLDQQISASCLTLESPDVRSEEQPSNLRSKSLLKLLFLTMTVATIPLILNGIISTKFTARAVTPVYIDLSTEIPSKDTFWRELAVNPLECGVALLCGGFRGYLSMMLIVMAWITSPMHMIYTHASELYMLSLMPAALPSIIRAVLIFFLLAFICILISQAWQRRTVGCSHSATIGGELGTLLSLVFGFVLLSRAVDASGLNSTLFAHIPMATLLLAVHADARRCGRCFLVCVS